MPLTQEEIDGCKDAFLAFDKDRSGSIDVWELRQVLEGEIFPPGTLGFPTSSTVCTLISFSPCRCFFFRYFSFFLLFYVVPQECLPFLVTTRAGAVLCSHVQ